jgi:hypothetical protein
MRSLKILFFLLFAAMNAAARNGSLTIERITRDLKIPDLKSDKWLKAKEILVNKYWDGSSAAAGRQFRVRMLWSDTALYVWFEANQTEPLVVGEMPILDSKTMSLWDRDVCEIFIAPDPKEPKKYFEFEVAPTGEWVDLAIDSTSGERVTDWDYRSGMKAAAKIEEHRVLMAMRIPWEAFGRKPKAGEVWLGNIFRCVGTKPNRGYLSWQPTLTEKPNFHVFEQFGEFFFE